MVQHAVELSKAHRPDRLRQGGRAAIVEIGWRRRHVAQAGDAYQRGLRIADWMEDAASLEKVAAHIDALVAGDAAKRLEQLIAGELRRRDRVGVARKPAVESAARREERALVGRDRIQQGGSVGRPAIRVPELPHRFGVGAQLASDLVRARRHDRWIAKRLLGLLFERAESACPVQAKAQGYIEDRQRIGRERPPLGRHVVGVAAGPVRSYIVARRTAARVIMRQAPVAKQSLSERQTPSVLGGRRRDWRNRFLTGAGLRGWRLRGRRRSRVETDERQQEARHPAARRRRDRCRRI